MSEDQEIQAQEDRAMEGAAARVQLAAMYRLMCSGGGFQDLKKELETKINDLKNKWLTADDVEGAKIKIRAQIYNEVFDIIKQKILAGDNASKIIEQIKARRQEQI